MSAETRVQRGIEFLEEKVKVGELPVHWRGLIDLTILDVDSLQVCVIGQLGSKAGFDLVYPNNPFGEVMMAWELNDSDTWSMGFDGSDTEDYEELQTVWRKVLG